MSNASLSVADLSTAQEAAAPPPRRPRTYLGNVARTTLGAIGAKIGVGWVLLVAVAAVFALFLASSHPLLMKVTSGQISSPVLEHLTAADVTLLVMTPVSLALLFLYRLSMSIRVGVFFGVLAVTIGITSQAVSPPKLVVFDRYRVMQAEGEIDWALHAPIPFSPTDRLRDQRGMRSQAPNTIHWLGTQPVLFSWEVGHSHRLSFCAGGMAQSGP